MVIWWEDTPICNQRHVSKVIIHHIPFMSNIYVHILQNNIISIKIILTSKSLLCKWQYSLIGKNNETTIQPGALCNQACEIFCYFSLKKLYWWVNNQTNKKKSTVFASQVKNQNIKFNKWYIILNINLFQPIFSL